MKTQDQGRGQLLNVQNAISMSSYKVFSISFLCFYTLQKYVFWNISISLEHLYKKTKFAKSKDQSSTL